MPLTPTNLVVGSKISSLYISSACSASPAISAAWAANKLVSDGFFKYFSAFFALDKAVDPSPEARAIIPSDKALNPFLSLLRSKYLETAVSSPFMNLKIARISETILRTTQAASTIKPKSINNCIGLIEYSKPEISIIVLPKILFWSLAK